MYGLILLDFVLLRSKLLTFTKICEPNYLLSFELYERKTTDPQLDACAAEAAIEA